MSIRRIGHYAVRTADLETSRRFYADILGFREGFRPDFDFPGVWFYAGDDEEEFGIVHLLGVDEASAENLRAYLGDTPSSGEGTGNLDHIALLADGLTEMRARLVRNAIPFTERRVPGLGLYQVFVRDPQGITIELNYPGAEAATFG